MISNPEEIKSDLAANVVPEASVGGAVGPAVVEAAVVSAGGAEVG